MKLFFIYFFSIFWFTLCYQIEPFYGDVPYSEYLTQFCLTNRLILVDNLSFTNQSGLRQSSKYTLFRHLLAANCNTRHYDNLTTPQLYTKLPKIEYFLRYRTTLLAFEFTQLNLNLDTLKNLIKSLSFLYQKCDHCLPFHIVFQESTPKIADFLTQAWDNLPGKFQAIIIPNWRQRHSAIHLRPIVHGCHQLETLFWPQTGDAYRQLKMHPKDCNLNGILLNISANEFMPYCGLSKAPNGELIGKVSLDIQFLALLSKRFNFRYTLIVESQSWGTLVNGTWTGSVGKVINGKSQIAICGLSRTLDRNREIDFLQSHFGTDVTFLSRSPQLASKVWFFVSPFSGSIWWALVLSFASFFLLLTGASKGDHVGWHLEILCAIALRQSHHKFGYVCLDAHSVRLYLATWLFATFLLFNLYSSGLYSFLALSTYEEALDTTSDLIAALLSDTFPVRILQNSHYEADFASATAENTVFYAIKSSLQRHEVHMIDGPLSVLADLEKAPQTVIILPRTILAYSRHAYRGRLKLHIARDNLIPVTEAFGLAKRSPLVAPFNELIEPLREMALFDHWLTQSGAPNMFSNPIDPIPRVDCQAFQLGDLHSIFVVLLFGHLLACLVGVIEIVLLLLCKVK